jgi:hypothetical protein
MIRKLKSGQYRLYSRKINPKTGKRRNLRDFRDAGKSREARARRPVLQAPRIAPDVSGPLWTEEGYAE